MFDGVEVVLGPRCGDAYPVVRGLEAGQKIVITGGFLLDAETRLNPSLAAGYFGAARRQTEAAASTKVAEGTPVSTEPDEAEASALTTLSPSDREQAKRQRICPVTRKPLGSMGTPVRLIVNGRVVFLCCSGCEGKLRRDASRYLDGLPQAGAKQP
jgi:hypothetical protein